MTRVESIKALEKACTNGVVEVEHQNYLFTGEHLMRQQLEADSNDGLVPIPTNWKVSPFWLVTPTDNVRIADEHDLMVAINK